MLKAIRVCLIITSYLVIRASQRYQPYVSQDNYNNMVKVPRINDRCMERDCKDRPSIGQYRTKYTDRYISKEDSITLFLGRNRLLLKMMGKVNNQKCKKCLCRIADEYAHYSGKYNKETGKCYPNLNVKHCDRGHVVYSKRRKTACILSAPLNTHGHGYHG